MNGMMQEEARCIIILNGKKVTASVVWKGGSKFKIVRCEEDNGCVGSIVDASDILKCLI